MSQYPVIAAGARITAGLLQSMLPNLTIKPADTPATSDITLDNDPDLVTDTLSAGGVYEVQFHLRVSGLTSAGIKTTWLTPSGTTGNRDCAGPGSANAVDGNANTTEMRWAVHGYGTSVIYTNPRNSTSLQTWLYEKSLVTIGATAGVINLRWAQNASAATATYVAAGSYVTWKQVA